MSLLNKIFRKNKPPKHVFKKWEHPYGWGRGIQLTRQNEKTGELNFVFWGHWHLGVDENNLPTHLCYVEVGDHVHIKMESGKIGVYRITRVEHLHDPSDMTWVDAMPFEYLD